MSQNLVVDLNKLVKIRFSDGDELLVRIFEKSPSQSTNGLPINKDAPLGKAILGHTKGEQIEYTVRNNTYKITLLEVYANKRNKTIGVQKMRYIDNTSYQRRNND